MTTRRIPFADLSLQWREIREETLPVIENLFAESAFCLGRYVEGFERDIAAFLEVKHAIGVSSGTAALHVATVAAGIGPGDEVLVPAHTFIATLWGVIYAGARPVLCD